MTETDPVGHPSQLRPGLLYGFAAYLLWGGFPFFFVSVKPAGPWEILGQRIAWTFVVCAVVLLVRRDLGWIRPVLRRPRLVGGLALAAGLIAVNWVVYVNAVITNHTSEAALGYFLNPLITVALGVLVLRERLRVLQWTAVAIGTVAGVFLAVVAGQVPLTALALAVSFALYSLAKNRVGASLQALHGLAIETTVLLPIALVLLIPMAGMLGTTFVGYGSLHTALLVLSGPVTAAPLLLFAAAARRVPLVTIGLLQFLTPVMQLLAALALGEHVSPARWAGFGIVWLALAVLTVDMLRQRPSR
ncbi:MAG: EamA family transporter RarD [Dermatophilaceae bacterium]